jgi:hypothetical protein
MLQKLSPNRKYFIVEYILPSPAPTIHSDTRFSHLQSSNSSRRTSKIRAVLTEYLLSSEYLIPSTYRQEFAVEPN